MQGSYTLHHFCYYGGPRSLVCVGLTHRDEQNRLPLERPGAITPLALPASPTTATAPAIVAKTLPGD